MRDHSELNKRERDAFRDENEIFEDIMYSGKAWDDADRIFGYFIRHGRKMRYLLEDYLEEAEERGQISPEQSGLVLSDNLLWGGQLKRTKEQLFLTVETSRRVKQHNLDRADARANILRSIGLKALGVVAGINWESGLRDKALNNGVVIVRNLRLDKESWEAAASKAGL